MYPTRAVRHAAWDALDFLFPVSTISFASCIDEIVWKLPLHLYILMVVLLHPCFSTFLVKFFITQFTIYQRESCYI